MGSLHRQSWLLLDPVAEQTPNSESIDTQTILGLSAGGVLSGQQGPSVDEFSFL